MVSYYTLPSTVLGNPRYDKLKAAFLYYSFSTRGEAALPGLLTDALILAHSKCARFPAASLPPLPSYL